MDIHLEFDNSLYYYSFDWGIHKYEESMTTFMFYRYQVAVGTSPGGGQVKAFYRIPTESKHHTVTGLNLDGYRQVSPKLSSY